MKKPEADPVVARNRKAAHDYHLGESWEAGIVLQGAEVKALRAGRASLVGGFAAVEDREIWLHGVHIPQYSQARWFNDGSRRKRKLLLHRAQIDKIERKVNESGLTIVPVTLYFKDGRAKVEIALARGKKTWDKRHALAEREASREVERAVSHAAEGSAGLICGAYDRAPMRPCSSSTRFGCRGGTPCRASKTCVTPSW